MGMGEADPTDALRRNSLPNERHVNLPSSSAMVSSLLTVWAPFTSCASRFLLFVLAQLRRITSALNAEMPPGK